MFHWIHSLPVRTLMAQVILKRFMIIFAMGLLACNEDSAELASLEVEDSGKAGLEVVAEQQHDQWWSGWCELIHIMAVMLKYSMRAMDNNMDDQLSDQVAVKIPAVAQQRPRLRLRHIRMVKHMRMLGKSLFPLDPFPKCWTAARQAICEIHRTSSSLLCTWEISDWFERVKQIPKPGSKRGLLEREMFQQHVNDCCALSVSEGSTKRIKYFRYVGCNTEKVWLGDSCGDGSNPNPEYLNGENCNRSRYVTKEKRAISNPKTIIVLPTKDPTGAGWNSLPCHLHENILQRVEFKDLFRFKMLSKRCKEYIESEDFSLWRGANRSQEGLFTAINYYIKDKTWRCSGFDLKLRIWRTLPPFSCLPPPDAELFKEYCVSGHGALMCADVSKLPKKGQLVVFNPLTGKNRPLPALLYPRNPVLVHMLVDSPTKSYKVIVAGSSTASDEMLSKKIEVFDSKTSEWEEASDLPGPMFGLNEHQAGVSLQGKLYFISFLEGSDRRGVVPFDVENRKWLENETCPIPFSTCSNTLQLVETGGNVYLFSEQERGGSVEHCIDMLEMVTCQWKNVVRVKKSGGRGLQVYPEHTCVAFGEGKLCVFNTLNRNGVVYDTRDGKEVEELPAPPSAQKGENFFALNPASFTLQPSFGINPIPSIVDMTM